MRHLLKLLTILYALTFLCISSVVVLRYALSPQVAVTPGTVPKGTRRLSAEAYKKTLADLTATLDRLDPRAAIDQLKDAMRHDPAVAASCHELLHGIGRAAYRKEGDFGKAAQFQDEVCVSGYIHGVLEGYLSGVKDVDAALLRVCGAYPPDSYRRWSCEHGVGHGLMFHTDDDLPESLAKCGLLQADPFDEGACANGVFMENFNTDQKAHFSRFLDPNRPTYPCLGLKKDSRDCYMNAPIYYLGLHPDDYAGLFRMCAAVDPEDRASCYYGAGGQATRRNVADPKFVEHVCAEAGAGETACFYGAVNGAIDHFVALEPVLKICAGYAPEHRYACYKAIADFRRSFSTF